MGEITILDYVLLPFYIWLIYKVAHYYQDKFYPPEHPYHKYFIPGLTVKIGGALFIGMFYFYYYGGGDSFNFFYHSQLINSTLFEAPDTWFRLIIHHADEANLTDAQAVSGLYWYDDASSYTTACLGAFIGLFCFTKYLIINCIVACISFIGTWLMFIAFARQYPQFIKPVAIAILFIPGPIVWGSGLYKDSFCMLALGALVYCAYQMFEKGELKLKILVLLSISIFLLLLIKAYILIAFLPALIIKVFLVYKQKLSKNSKNRGTFYMTMFIAIVCVVGVIKQASSYVTAYAIQSTLETIKHQKDYLLQVSIDEGGSAYDLGDFEPTVGSILSKFWPAVNVTLFRPYIWESRSIIQLFEALQSLIMLLLTIYIFLKNGILRTVKMIYKDPNLIMCLLFTLMFAFLVGISTYNFGSLSRYKIPCIPFYMLFLLILFYTGKSRDKNKDSESADANIYNSSTL